MSNKFKIIGIIALFFGVGLISSGLIINGYLRSEVSKGISEALLGIQEDVVPEIEDIVKTQAIPDVLLGIQEDAMPIVHTLVNGTFMTVMLNMSLHNVSLMGGLVTAIAATPETIFNNDTYQFELLLMGSPIFTFDGISNHTGMGNLSYTPEAQQTILFGKTNPYVPGLLEDLDPNPELDPAFGVVNFLSLYQEAVDDPVKNATMQLNYNATWQQLLIMADWISVYFFLDRIPALLPLVSLMYPEYAGKSTLQIADEMFYDQWANATLGAFDLGEMLSLPYSVIGFEVGYPDPSNISLSIARDLWNPNNSSSFVNITYDGEIPSLQDSDGLQKWIDANSSDIVEAEDARTELKLTFGLSDTQMDILLEWMWGYNQSFKEDVVPPLFEYDQGVSIARYSEILFYGQWANGSLFPEGIDIGEAIGIGELKGWELGVPTPSNLSLQAVETLFNLTGFSSLVNSKGLEKWFNAYTNSDIYDELKFTLGCDDAQMKAILNWLKYFRNNIVPPLAKYDEGLPVDPLTLSEMFLYGLTIPGGIVAALGVIVLILARRKKRT
ncbi:MAG: hypothetical protein ACFE8L_01420 [Candidatus Hodarchaeota archaeon]